MSPTAYVPREAIAQMFDTAPRDWWRFVPCGMCNSPRQEPCQQWDGPARKPHIGRVRLGLAIHATLWLLREHPEDVLEPRGDA